MGKKYIIELEEPEMFDERKYYQCSQMPWWAVSENIVENLTPYTEPDIEQVRKEAYEEGRKVGIKDGMCEAWEVARKVVGLETVNRRKVFGTEYMYSILENNTATEAIEKIRQYEQEKEEDGLRQNIQTIVDQCGYSLDEIAEVLQKMREESNG